MPDTCPTVNRGRSSSSNGNDGTVIHSLAQTTSKRLRARYAATRRARRDDPLPSGSDLLLAVGVNLDLARLGGRQQRQTHGQHAIGESGIDVGGVERVTQGETAGEGAGNPLAGDQL